MQLNTSVATAAMFLGLCGAALGQRVSAPIKLFTAPEHAYSAETAIAASQVNPRMVVGAWMVRTHDPIIHYTQTAAARCTRCGWNGRWRTANPATRST